MALHTVAQEIEQLFFVFLFGAQFESVPGEIPVFLFSHPVPADDQTMARLKRIRVAIDRLRSRNVEIGEQIGNGCWFYVECDLTRFANAFQLRPKSDAFFS